MRSIRLQGTRLRVCLQAGKSGECAGADAAETTEQFVKLLKYYKYFFLRFRRFRVVLNDLLYGGFRTLILHQPSTQARYVFFEVIQKVSV